MTFEQAFRKILLESEYDDIQAVANNDYLYEVEKDGVLEVLTEEEVIKLAETI